MQSIGKFRGVETVGSKPCLCMITPRMDCSPKEAELVVSLRLGWWVARTGGSDGALHSGSTTSGVVGGTAWLGRSECNLSVGFVGALLAACFEGGLAQPATMKAAED